MPCLSHFYLSISKQRPKEMLIEKILRKSSKLTSSIMTQLDVADRYQKGSELTSKYDIVGETADGMPVATIEEKWFYLTDGIYLLTDGYQRVDPLGSYTYVCWYGKNCKEIVLDPERIDFDKVEEIRDSHERV